MAVYQVFKETALPAVRQPHSIYFVAPPANPNFIEVYVTGANGTTVKRTPSQADIQAMIDAAIVSNANNGMMVDTIAERDVISDPRPAQTVYVIDAASDPSVSSGGATYMWNAGSSTWVKISEAESMDLVNTWATLQGKPNSAPADIDNAVTLRHTHANKTQLDLIGQDGQGYLTYNGQLPHMAWDSTGW